MDKRDHDQRVQRTRGAIVESFNGLALQRSYSSIRVSDVVGEAGVGRSTFYEHFRNIDEVLLQSASGMLGVLADAATESGDAERVRCVLEHFWEVRPTARALLRDPSGVQVARRLADLIEERLAEQWRGRDAPPIIPPRLVAAQAAGAQLGLIGAWLGGAAACDSGALARAITDATRAIVRAAHQPPR